jgi:hypothetical protein
LLLVAVQVVVKITNLDAEAVVVLVVCLLVMRVLL